MKRFTLAVIFCFSILHAEEINLGIITTYIDSPVVEQRQIFTQEQISEMDVADLPSLLVAAGVQILSYGPYGLEQKPSIRGFTDETVRVVIDGVCVNNPQYGIFDFSSLNIQDIERIEIVHGGFTEGVSDEGAVGGVIYITTKAQTLGHHFYTDSSVKSYFNKKIPADTFSQALGYNGQIGDSSFLKSSLKGTYASNRFFYYDYLSQEEERQNAEVKDINGLINFQHYFGNGKSFTVSDSFYGGKKNTPGNIYSVGYGVQQDYDNNISLQLLIPDAFQKRIKIENTASWLSNTRFYTDAGSDSKHYVNTAKYAGIMNLYGFENIKQSFGLTLDYTHLNSTDDGIHNQFSGTLKSTTKIQRGRFSFSVPMAAKFCNENFAFVPKLGFGFDTEYLNVYLDGYRMIQFPNMDDLYWDGGGFHGNPDLKPENGWGGDLTFNVHNVWLPFSLCIFTNYYENKIQWAGNTPQNVASAFYLGTDLNFEKSFWNNRIFVRGNGEYLYTRLLDKTKNSYGKRIMWTPDFVGSASAGVNFTIGDSGDRPLDFSFMVDGNFMGVRYNSNLNASYMEPYFLLNLCGEVKIPSKNLEFVPYFRIDNVLNTAYESVTDYPMPGISATLGLKIRN